MYNVYQRPLKLTYTRVPVLPSCIRDKNLDLVSRHYLTILSEYEFTQSHLAHLPLSICMYTIEIRRNRHS